MPTPRNLLLPHALTAPRSLCIGSVLLSLLLIYGPIRRSRYQQHGWTCVRGLLGRSVTDRARSILSSWADRTINSWVDEGLLDDARSHLPFGTRLLECWNASGEPQYSRSPRRDLASPDMYELLSDPVLADLARRLMGTEKILSHSIFNARPKLPAQPWTDTPWHQVRIHVVCLTGYVGFMTMMPARV